MKDKTPFRVVFPQMTMKISDDESWVAIAYTGEAQETGDVKLGTIPAGMVASKVCRGSYEGLSVAIGETYKEILETKRYAPDQHMPMRLLYWNSPDDNQPQDLVAEIQIPVIKRP